MLDLNNITGNGMHYNRIRLIVPSATTPCQTKYRYRYKGFRSYRFQALAIVRGIVQLRPSDSRGKIMVAHACWAPQYRTRQNISPDTPFSIAPSRKAVKSVPVPVLVRPIKKLLPVSFKKSYFAAYILFLFFLKVPQRCLIYRYIFTKKV
jgi:hypothetical protein